MLAQHAAPDSPFTTTGSACDTFTTLKLASFAGLSEARGYFVRNVRAEVENGNLAKYLLF